MTDIFGIYWAGIDWIIILPLFAVAIFLIIRNFVRIRSVADVIVDSAHTKTIFKNFSKRRYAFKTILLVVTLITLFLALLQPQWGKKEQQVIQETRDLVVVLDVSRSMLAGDLKPNRLEFAKLKIRHLLSKLKIERVGLVLFSGTSFLQCPLTIDHENFLMFLQHVDTEVISSGTTAIDKALLQAVQVYAQSKGRKNKLVLLITDGEDFSRNLSAVKQQAKKQNVTLFALGIGSIDGAPIPKLNHRGETIGHEKDEFGSIAMTKLNEPLLQEICNELDGIYIKSDYDDSDIDRLVDKIQEYEREEFTDQKISLYEDQYPWLVGLAWICLLLEWII